MDLIDRLIVKMESDFMIFSSIDCHCLKRYLYQHHPLPNGKTIPYTNSSDLKAVVKVIQSEEGSQQSARVKEVAPKCRH